jgi:E3 ubiquitin-protein ligase MARCH6
MFHFALFVGMCRKILRKGVLWFIRDPDDPTFHPVRDVLERNVATQLRKIAFSALVYGALVILCLGGVIWTIGHIVNDIFPIHWVSTEPVIEFPMDLLLYNFVTPLVIRLFKPSDAVNSMYAWWLQRCARMLRLSHFLFDDRRKDEEGHLVHPSWTSFLLMRRVSGDDEAIVDAAQETKDGQNQEVFFQRDGKYVLTPCNDQYRPPKPGEAFLHADDEDVYIADKDGKRNDHFAKVYVPPYFRLRITAFMVCLWMFSAFIGLCATLVPLIFGRYLFASFTLTGAQVNDIYAYSVGAYTLGGAIFLALKGRAAFVYLRNKARKIDIKAWIEPMQHFTVQTLKCSYVYGFLGVMVPIFFALLLQFYLILPLHTWTVAAMDNQHPQQTSNGTNSTLQLLSETPQTQQMNLPSLAGHTIHILQDYALGLLYVRMASRLIVAAPASRAAEAFRRITQDGYLNPNIRLATRFFVLPVTLIAAFLLLFPPLVTNIGLTATHAFASDETWAAVDTEFETKMYRYSYPLAASGVVLVLGVREVGKATSRWRARIRDEVYLVGERLHNFGEKKPPPGSKSVIRKER